MKLVTYDDGKVGRIDGEEIVRLDVPTMREYFERGEVPPVTGREFALEDVRLRAPIVPKKFFHTAGNFREHEEESKRVNWSHEIASTFWKNMIHGAISCDQLTFFDSSSCSRKLPAVWKNFFGMIGARSFAPESAVRSPASPAPPRSKYSRIVGTSRRTISSPSMRPTFPSS